MPKTMPVYLEVGSKRVFAAALDWPGWSRAGRDEAEALESLAAYGQRYARAVGSAARGLRLPEDVSAMRVVERLKGNATTDFGAPGIAPSSDATPLPGAELRRLETLLPACWTAFDEAARAAASAVLRKGPRGGGRDLDAIVAHVLDADVAYLSGLGGTYHKPAGANAMKQMRCDFLEVLAERAGGAVPVSTRRSPYWTPRYAVRRSAWHALDHAWEIEDRASK